MSELLPLAVKRAICSLRRRTNKGLLYPKIRQGVAVFACSPSPHLSPSKLPVLPEKRDSLLRFLLTPLQKFTGIRTMKLQGRFAKMRKAMGIAVLTALILSFSGCTNTENPHTTESSSQETVSAEIIQRTEPEDSSSASVSESKESATESTATVKAEKESTQAENSQSAAEQSPAPGTQPPQTAVPNNTPKPETPKAVEPTPEPKPTPTQQPTPSPAEETPKIEQPQEIIPATEEPAVPEFDIQTWIDYAKTYAVSVGLRLKS
jgi:hypothetical protein